MLAFTSPDGPEGARVELSTPQSTQTAVMQAVAQLLPARQTLGDDGSAPVGFLMLAAPHPPGMYSWSQYLQVRVLAAALMDATLSFADELGPQTMVYTQGLGTVGLFTPALLPFFSSGTQDIRVDLAFGGGGPPLLLDYITSIAQTGSSP